MNQDIEKFIAELGKEIEKAQDSYEKSEQMQRLQDIARTYKGDDEVISSLELTELIKTRPEQKKVLSGFGGLDDILGGFRERQLIVVAAPTKSGKTTFCIELTIRMVNENVLWFPFEEGAEELIQKFLDRNEQPPLFYTPKQMKGNTLSWIEKKIIEAIAKYDSKIVFIDHLHFIVPFSEERQDLRIGETMRELKRLANAWGITIFLIAHLKKTRVDTSPTLEDLRDSSFVAQEADTVMLLWRETTREKGDIVISNNVNLSIQANRRTGKTGNIKLIYKDGRFFEEAWGAHAEEDIEAQWK